MNNKYDQWHRDILNKFGLTVGENMKTFNKTIQAARRQLETLSIDASDDVTLFVTEIQEMKRNLTPWEVEVNKFKTGNKLLVSQRYQHQADWLNIDIVEGEWNAFKQILQKKSKTMDDQIPALQSKIISEEQLVLQKVKEIEEEWKTKRPHQSNVTPSAALNQLAIIGKRISTAKNELVRICKAKDLLVMEPGDPKRLDALEEDLGGLKAVWSELNKVWTTTIEVVNDTPFSAYVHKKIKELLDTAFDSMNEFPNRLRQYEVFE